jgi:hypothetical protein
VEAAPSTLTPERGGPCLLLNETEAHGDSWSTYESSFVGPDPDQKLLAGSGSGKNHSGCGYEQLRIRNEFEVKLLLNTGKILKFLNKKKNSQLKN